MTIGINWHNLVGGTVEPWGNMLMLPSGQAGNIGWFGSSSGNGNTDNIVIGFNANLTVPVNGVASATDGWPVASGQALPFLTGEGQDIGGQMYAVGTAANMDFFVIGYAPDQGASVTTALTTVIDEDNLTDIVLEDGTTLVRLEF